MNAMSARRFKWLGTPNRNILDLVMVTIYIALTTYLLPTGSAPSICLILNAAVRPFQITVRARNAEAERSAEVWRLPQSQGRVQCASRER
jgi:hypothetical protein